MRHRSSSAFTLVELVVTVFIIALLASMALPSVRTGIEKAKSAKCLSNLRQIGTAVQQYVADPVNAHRYPPIYNVGSGNTNPETSANTALEGASTLQPLACLEPYGVTLQLLTCPADRAPNPTYGSYIWSPILQDEQPENVVIYTPGGAFSVSKLSSLTICTDNGRPHLGRFNILRADGHVETR